MRDVSHWNWKMTEEDERAFHLHCAAGVRYLLSMPTKDPAGGFVPTICGFRVDEIPLPKAISDYPLTPRGNQRLMDDLMAGTDILDWEQRQ